MYQSFTRTLFVLFVLGFLSISSASADIACDAGITDDDGNACSCSVDSSADCDCSKDDLGTICWCNNGTSVTRCRLWMDEGVDGPYKECRCITTDCGQVDAQVARFLSELGNGGELPDDGQVMDPYTGLPYDSRVVEGCSRNGFLAGIGGIDIG